MHTNACFLQHPVELGPSEQRKQQLSDEYWNIPEKGLSILLKIWLRDKNCSFHMLPQVPSPPVAVSNI